jgi:hypothetical protein
MTQTFDQLRSGPDAVSKGDVVTITTTTIAGLLRTVQVSVSLTVPVCRLRNLSPLGYIADVTARLQLPSL